MEQLKKEIKIAQYKAVEIDDLKAFIEQALQQMLNRNCTRQKFSQRFRNIIDRYNAGGSENEDYYKQLLQLIEDMKAEDKRPEAEGLSEEELEIFDLLIAGKKLTKADVQKVKLSAKNLFKKLTTEKSELMVVDWYKDDQPREKVKKAIESSEYVLTCPYISHPGVRMIRKCYDELSKAGIEVDIYEHERLTDRELLSNLIASHRQTEREVRAQVDAEVDAEGGDDE